MNPLFNQLLGQASHLTQAGDLHGAVAAIQTALGRTMAHGTPKSVQATSNQAPTETIDVIAREVHESPAASQADAFLAGRHSGIVGARDYKLYVPPSYQGQSKALPLVVMLHGCTQDPDDFAAGTHMNEAAKAQGFFVLYPAQTQQANPQRCWNWFKHSHQQRGRGEPAILAAMTQEVIKQYGIDPDRVYVAGLSAGGAMAAILGETYPDLFAAVGVHSGLANGAASDVSGAFAAMKGGTGALPGGHGLADLPGLSGGMGRNRADMATQAAPAPRPASGRPTIVFHGDRDNTVHPVNGERVVAACVKPDPRSQGERARSGNGRHYTRQAHRDDSGRIVAEHWVVHGAGHAWSGGHPRGSYTDAQGPDATQEMLRFFFANARPKSS